MVIYKPVSEISALKEMFPDFCFETNLVYGGYFAENEDGTKNGKCLFCINGYDCEILKIECDCSDRLLVEGYIRASLNYCANRNAYMAYCGIEKISPVLNLLGFENNKGIYNGDIPTLLKGSCCK